MCASMALHLGLPVSSLKILDDENEHENSTNSDYDRAHLTAAWSSLLIDRYVLIMLHYPCGRRGRDLIVNE